MHLYVYFLVVSVILLAPIPTLVCRVSRPKLLAGSMALLSVSCILMAFSSSYWQLLVLRSPSPVTVTSHRHQSPSPVTVTATSHRHRHQWSGGHRLLLYRMGTALGEGTIRPAGSSLIAEMFHSNHRGVANGIFSWGVSSSL